MPDAWENQYGLNPLDARDASQDADSDCLTNLAEYQHATDPNVEDDLEGLGLTVSCSEAGDDWWLWLLFILLVSGALFSFWKSIKHTKAGGKSSRRKR
jgi:hypothetical protein